MCVLTPGGQGEVGGTGATGPRGERGLPGGPGKTWQQWLSLNRKLYLKTIYSREQAKLVLILWWRAPPLWCFCSWGSFNLVLIIDWGVKSILGSTRWGSMRVLTTDEKLLLNNLCKGVPDSDSSLLRLRYIKSNICFPFIWICSVGDQWVWDQ